MPGWIGISVALSLAVCSASLHWSKRRSIIVLAISAIISCVASPHAHAQEHEDREWVKVEARKVVGGTVQETRPGQLEGLGGGTYTGQLGGSSSGINLTVSVASEGGFRFDVEQGNGHNGGVIDPNDHYTGKLVNIGAFENSTWHFWITEWGPPLEDEELQPRQYVEVRLKGDATDEQHAEEWAKQRGTWRLEYIPASDGGLGRYVLPSEGERAVITLDMQRNTVDDFDFTVAARTPMGQTRSKRNVPPFYDGILDEYTSLADESATDRSR